MAETEKKEAPNEEESEGAAKALSESAREEEDQSSKTPNVPLLRDTFQQIASQFPETGEPVKPDKKIRLGGRILLKTQLKINPPLPAKPLAPEPSTPPKVKVSAASISKKLSKQKVKRLKKEKPAEKRRRKELSVVVESMPAPQPVPEPSPVPLIEPIPEPMPEPVPESSQGEEEEEVVVEKPAEKRPKKESPAEKRPKKEKLVEDRQKKEKGGEKKKKNEKAALERTPKKERPAEKRQKKEKPVEKKRKREFDIVVESIPVPPPAPVPVVTDEDNSENCPECHLPDDGSMMIQCDDPFCAKWFHGKCVDLLEEPKEEESWFCRVCVDKQASAFQRRRRVK